MTLTRNVRHSYEMDLILEMKINEQKNTAYNKTFFNKNVSD